MVSGLVSFIPLALVGIWRWSVWGIKVAVAQAYSPFTHSVDTELDVSVVVPVYRADPDEFMEAVQTWLANDPKELIAVIDEGDNEIIRRFRALSDTHENVTCIVTPKPGKRPALRDGVSVATGDIIALVDDDVRWRMDTKREFLKPFADPDIGAVSPKQTVAVQTSLPQRLYEIQLRLLFEIDTKALTHVSRSLSCVSGRTGVYRREAIKPVIDDLTEETFLGKDVISGDDKFLTRAVQANGWDAVYQSSSVIDIGATEDTRTFLSQTIRWTRNTIRSDLKAMGERWVFRRKGLAYYNFDRFIASFAILLAPLYFTLTLNRGIYIVSAAILLWWGISRTVKMYPYLRKYPTRVTLVPLYTLGTFVMSPVYLYALFSANAQGWLTRGDDSRFGLAQLRRRAVTVGSVMLVGLTIGSYVLLLLQIRY